MKEIIVATLAVLACAASALADLDGTDLTLSVNHGGLSGAFSAINNHNYTYGTPTNITVPNWGMLAVTSPAVAGFDNAVNLDFTQFAYSGFTGPLLATTGTAKLLDIDEPFDLSSVQVLVNGANFSTGISAVGNGFQASWSSQAVFDANPVAPYVTVAWNSVPAPGALALLGIGGALTRSRRRRD